MELHRQYKWSATINGILAILIVVIGFILYIHIGDIINSLLSSIPAASICGIIAVAHWWKYKRLADSKI